MKCLNWRRCAGLLTAGGATTWFLLSYGGAAAQQDAKQAPPPKPVTMSLQHRAPAGAVFLFDGKPADITDKWFARGSTNPAGWKVEDGVVTVDGHDITSKQEFGDCQLHVEWRAIDRRDARRARRRQPVRHRPGDATQGRIRVARRRRCRRYSNDAVAQWRARRAARERGRVAGRATRGGARREGTRAARLRARGQRSDYGGRRQHGR